MPAFSGNQGAHTPATTQDNWTLDTNAVGEMAKVVSIGWGGRLTTSTGYRTRWVRPTTAGSGALTGIATEAHSPNFATPNLQFGTFATAPVLPTDPDALHAQDWNAHGGLGYVVLPLATPWWLVDGVLTGQLSCRNIAGVDASGSSYGVTWEEM